MSGDTSFTALDGALLTARLLHHCLPGVNIVILQYFFKGRSEIYSGAKRR